jgi:hypothetical protein
VRELAPAFAAGTICGEQSGGKPPHSKKLLVSSRTDRPCPRSFGSLIPTKTVEERKHAATRGLGTVEEGGLN